MTTSPEFASPNRPADVLSVRSPSALLTSVPYLVGFAPTNSLVVLMLARPRARVVMTVRIDLPRDVGKDSAAEFVKDLVPRVTQVGADAAIAVIYANEPGSAGSGDPWTYPHKDLVFELRHALDLFDVTLNDAILVSEGRRWSYLCEIPGCCPVDGVPIDDDESQSVRARLVWEGLAPAASRDEVVARVEPDAAAQQLVRDEIATIAPDAHDHWRSKDLYGLLDLVLDEVDGTLKQRHVHIARLLCALTSIPMRDLVLRQLVLVSLRRRGARALMDALCAVLRCAPKSYIAPIATVTALLSWQAGDGLIAMEAVTRALTDDSDYSMAKLAFTAIDAGLPPQVLVEMFEHISEEECMNGRVSSAPTEDAAS